MKRLSPERVALYKELGGIVGHTPLGELKKIRVPNGNRIFYKEEYLNPTGSHYDRAFIPLLRSMEEGGKIEPGVTPLLETTTGNSGASFAWLCRILGYECEVFIPADMPAARFAQIRAYGAKLHFSPPGEYVVGLIDTFVDYLKHHKGYGLPNHAEDEVHVIGALADCGREIIDDLEKLGVKRIDYFISALGNGTTTRGLGTFLTRERRTKIVGVEPKESPTILQMLFPDRFRQEFQFASQTGKHGLIGTGPGYTNFRFVNMQAIMKEIHNIITVDREEWQLQLRQLHDIEGKHVGHTSAACLHAALKIASEEYDKVFVLIFYDPYWKYLELPQMLINDDNSPRKISRINGIIESKIGNEVQAQT